ncbi:MAG: hypothetical protein PVF89_02250 [Lysobacterales bacterium]
MPVAKCYVIYDAGSSGTRLNIIQHSTGGWVSHAGPTAGPLADPARGIRGKTMQDAESVTDAIVALLEAIRHPGPQTSGGVRGWPAFDWRKRCDVRALAVYATGGMRLAEQRNPRAAALLWAMLKRKLDGKTRAPVSTRTLSGFEEGLYAWLSIRATQRDDDFGVADMGGASAQVTFPCTACRRSVPVRVGRDTVSIVSVSFLGLGQDEAWRKYGHRPACRRGAGRDDPDWNADLCTRGIALTDGRKDLSNIPLRLSDADRWFLGGALRYLQPANVERYCRAGGNGGFQPERACFRTLYQLYFLQALGIPADAIRVDDNWALGAAICAATHCLAAKRQ